MEEAERTRADATQATGEGGTAQVTHNLEQIEKTYSKDGLGRFQHWDNT